MSNEEMTKIIGGVGGANEATCPYCGKPMKGGYSDGTIVNGWHCASCGLSTDASDAETIQIIKFLEQSGVQDIAYPVWWKQVVH